MGDNEQDWAKEDIAHWAKEPKEKCKNKMGLSLETLRLSFPKSTAALKKHHALIEKLATCDADRQTLKASANMLVLVAGQEILERAEVVSKAKAGIELIRGLFGK